MENLRVFEPPNAIPQGNHGDDGDDLVTMDPVIV